MPRLSTEIQNWDGTDVVVVIGEVPDGLCPFRGDRWPKGEYCGLPSVVWPDYHPPERWSGGCVNHSQRARDVRRAAARRAERKGQEER